MSSNEKESGAWKCLCGNTQSAVAKAPWGSLLHERGEPSVEIYPVGTGFICSDCVITLFADAIVNRLSIGGRIIEQLGDVRFSTEEVAGRLRKALPVTMSVKDLVRAIPQAFSDPKSVSSVVPPIKGPL